MFASNNNGNNHSHKDPAAGEREALSTLFLIVAGAIAIKFNAIRHFYYQNFEMIWFALWAAHSRNAHDRQGTRSTYGAGDPRPLHDHHDHAVRSRSRSQHRASGGDVHHRTNAQARCRSSTTSCEVKARDQFGRFRSVSIPGVSQVCHLWVPEAESDPLRRWSW